MKVALVYDRVNKWGGAERVLLALHELFPKAPLYTSVYNPKTAPWAKEFKVKTSFLQYIPYAKNNHELFALFMPLAFRQFSFNEYDLVISVTSEFAKGIKIKGKTKHVCYLLTPTRYLWSGYSDYFKTFFVKALTFPLVFLLRAWDKKIAQNPDVIISISKEVQKRTRKYYQRESVVVYPPFTLATSSNKSKTKGYTLKSDLRSKRSLDLVATRANSYFLVVSRLVSYKKIELAIRACNNLRLPLKIIGTGSQEEKLKFIAGPTVEFLGTLTDGEVVRYYKNCSALLFPGAEDFGLTIVEAGSFGKPVIAYKSGGALEIVIEGKTGVFFAPQTINALIHALNVFIKNKNIFLEKDCKENAKRFSLHAFKVNFLKEVKNII